jgi:hypothetical protein
MIDCCLLPKLLHDVLFAKTKLNSVTLAREQTISTERPPLVGEVLPSFADKGCSVVSATDYYGR